MPRLQRNTRTTCAIYRTNVAINHFKLTVGSMPGISFSKLGREQTELIRLSVDDINFGKIKFVAFKILLNSLKRSKCSRIEPYDENSFIRGSTGQGMLQKIALRKISSSCAKRSRISIVVGENCRALSGISSHAPPSRSEGNAISR